MDPTLAESGCSGRVVVQWWFAERPFRAWRSLSSAGLLDQSRRVTEMRLRPFSLAPDTYDFRATASYEADSSDVSERLFEVVVVSRHRHPSKSSCRELMNLINCHLHCVPLHLSW